jgi:hypothetical protein
LTSINLSFPAAVEATGDFHLHGFDEGDVVAIPDLAAHFHRKRADAPRHLGHDLDLWHSSFLPLSDEPAPFATAFCCGRRLPEVACSASGILFRMAEWEPSHGKTLGTA